MRNTSPTHNSRFVCQPHTTRDIALCVPKTGDLGQRGRLGHDDHDFAMNMAGLDMANSSCDFAQRVGAVDNGNHVSIFHAVDRAAEESGTRSANLRQVWCKESLEFKIGGHHCAPF
jgi:hypothetical protein